MELDPQVSPEQIMSREVELDPQVSPEEIMSREVERDPQVSPEEIKRREVELGCESWTCFASGRSSTAVQRTLSLLLCQAWYPWCSSRYAMVRGRRFNTSIILAAVHGLSGLFRVVSAVEPSLTCPLSPVPVPNKQPRFCGR